MGYRLLYPIISHAGVSYVKNNKNAIFLIKKFIRAGVEAGEHISQWARRKGAESRKILRRVSRLG
jgi:hypothetical protein